MLNLISLPQCLEDYFTTKCSSRPIKHSGSYLLQYLLCVLYINFRYVFGITHVPRLEDWPVMPVERIGFMLQVCLLIINCLQENEPISQYAEPILKPLITQISKTNNCGD